MRSRRAWLAGAALLLTSGVVVALTPGPLDTLAPFLVTAQADGPAAGRTLIAEIESTAFADHVETSRWDADGNWLVVTLSASAAQTEEEAEIVLAKLVIDGREYFASERPGDASIAGAQLRVGSDKVGTLAFELPADIVSGHAELRLSPNYSTPRLDDVLVLPLDLDDLDRQPRIELTEPELKGAS